MGKTPNDKFRDARESTPSPANPDECLSRQEVADQANAWIWEHQGKTYDLNAGYIGKIEQGIIRWPDAVRRAAFRALFKASKDSELGLINARARSCRAVVKLDDVDNMKRRKIFENVTTLGVSGLLLDKPMAALLEDSEADPLPRRIGASEIAQIRDATREFASWSSAYGGGTARATVRAQVRWSASCLEATYPERLRPELHCAVGELAEVAGYMALDAGAQEEARRVFGFALYCAEQAQDWNLRAVVLSDVAGQARQIGQPDEALTLAELALVRPDRLTLATQSLLHTNRAFALAKMRQVQEALTAVGTADEHFAHVTPDNEPSTVAFYTAAKHAQYTGRALGDLALLGRDPGEATTRLTTAATGYPEGSVRGLACCLTKLATVTMATGDPLHATTLGHQALEVAAGIRSHRAADDLRDLSRHAATHQNLGEVADLRHRIATLLDTDNPQEESPLTRTQG